MIASLVRLPARHQTRIKAKTALPNHHHRDCAMAWLLSKISGQLTSSVVAENGGTSKGSKSNLGTSYRLYAYTLTYTQQLNLNWKKGQIIQNKILHCFVGPWQYLKFDITQRSIIGSEVTPRYREFFLELEPLIVGDGCILVNPGPLAFRIVV